MNRTGKRTIKSAFQRVWDKVDKRGDDECWPWTATKIRNSGGIFYGQISVDGKGKFVTRIIMEMKLGAEFPPGLVVRHKCDYGLCCNPDHLELGTQKENVQDMYDRGRNKQCRGSQHGHAIFTESQVSAIRMAVAAGERQVSVAARYGVSNKTIHAVLRRNWKHVA